MINGCTCQNNYTLKHAVFYLNIALYVKLPTVPKELSKTINQAHQQIKKTNKNNMQAHLQHFTAAGIRNVKQTLVMVKIFLNKRKLNQNLAVSLLKVLAKFSIHLTLFAKF